ncbi:MAG: hypothetical protein FWG45_05730 [Oscillospiraceae bacterium]|nr:hypothetical protein [Oscillospiraceae bacterium]
MDWKLNKTQNKVPHCNKSIYIAEHLVEKIERIAGENNTSVNNVIVSMIESCLKEEENDGV